MIDILPLAWAADFAVNEIHSFSLPPFPFSSPCVSLMFIWCRILFPFLPILSGSPFLSHRFARGCAVPRPLSKAWGTPQTPRGGLWGFSGRKGLLSLSLPPMVLPKHSSRLLPFPPACGFWIAQLFPYFRMLFFSFIFFESRPHYHLLRYFWPALLFSLRPETDERPVLSDRWRSDSFFFFVTFWIRPQFPLRPPPFAFDFPPPPF